MAERSRSTRGRVLLVHRSGLPGRRRRQDGRKRLHRRPRRQSDLQAGLRRRYRPCRGDPDHLRPRAAELRRSARHLFRDPRSDPAQSPGQRRRHPISLGDLPAGRGAGAQGARRRSTRNNADHGGRIVTTIEPQGEWYPAEDYHQDYWAGRGAAQPLLPGGDPAQAAETAQELPGACQKRATPAA